MSRLAVLAFAFAATSCRPETPPDPTHHIAPNVKTSFTPNVYSPQIHSHDFIHPLASIIGAVDLGVDVLVAPGASVRGDEGTPIKIGDYSNIQDGVVIHALETFDHGHPIDANLVTVANKRYAVYVGNRVSIAHQAQIHGPASVGDNTFVGMQSLVFRARIAANCVLEPRALVMGVNIAEGRYVQAGQIVRTQADADALPKIDENYAFAHLNEGVLHVNKELAEGYEKAF